MSECLTTSQHKNKSAIGCQTNDIYIKHKKSNVYKLYTQCKELCKMYYK